MTASRVVYCFASEPDGCCLVQDAQRFDPNSYHSVRRLWRKILEWNAKFAGDPKHRWIIAPQEGTAATEPPDA